MQEKLVSRKIGIVSSVWVFKMLIHQLFPRTIFQPRDSLAHFSILYSRITQETYRFSQTFFEIREILQYLTSQGDNSYEICATLDTNEQTFLKVIIITSVFCHTIIIVRKSGYIKQFNFNFMEIICPLRLEILHKNAILIVPLINF